MGTCCLRVRKSHRTPNSARFPGTDSSELPRLNELYTETLHSVRCPCMLVLEKNAPQILDGVDVKEWIAVKMVDLFGELSVLCNAISEICTSSTCPVMRAGRYYEYAWADPSSLEYTVPTIVTAPKYMELLMSWVDMNLNKLNESRMNTGSFNINIKVFCRRLFRVYAHIFCEHFDTTKPIHAHLRYSLFHFIIFMNEYGLMVSETEAEPVRGILQSFEIDNLSFTVYSYHANVLSGYRLG